MNAGRFEQILRQFAGGSRRRTLKILTASALGSLVVHATAQEAAAVDCLQEAINGTACLGCPANYCFLDPLSNQCFCCAAEKFCQHPTNFEFDQCCYADEVCKPERASETNSFSICCRKCRRCRGCATKCCDSDRHCRNGKCRLLTTARAIRRRS